MTKFYATNDSEGSKIAEGATIAAFDTYAEAVTYLLSAYDPADGWQHETAEISGGSFGDCWIKYYSAAPRVGVKSYAPFSFTQLNIRAPGQHPGGKAWWIEPSAEILVIEKIECAD